MGKLILHIGRQKTGTSSIQKFLYSNSPFLDNLGINYPVHLVKTGYAHHSYAGMLQRRNFAGNSWLNELNDLKKAFNPILDSIQQNDTSLISSEAFQNCDPLLVSKIFEGVQTQIVVYIRNELEFIASAYNQRVHATDYHESIGSYVSNHDKLTSVFLDSWNSNFTRLQVRIFSRELLDGGEVVHDFTKNILDVNPSLFTFDAKDVNPSLPRKTLALKFHFNSEYQFRGNSMDLYRYFSMLSQADKSGKFGLPEKLKEKIQPKFEEDQKLWARKFFEKDSVFSYSDSHSADEYMLTELEKAELIDDLKTTFPGRIVEK